MTASKVKTGQKFEFTPTGKVFEIAKVTETRISWYIGQTVKSSWGVNNMRMAWASMKQFQSGLDKGSYKLI